MSYTPTPYPDTSAAADNLDVPRADSSASPANLAAGSPRPAHHLHKSSDVLPGTQDRGAQDDRDSGYRAPAPTAPELEPESESESYESRTGAWVAAPGEMGMARQQPDPVTGKHDSDSERRNAWTEERPLGVRPTERGGVAVGGRADVPETHASAADKLVGKTQKVVGKVTGKPELHERGELREAGGKAAARGEGRAPHD